MSKGARTPRRLVFDIETEPFREGFNDARTADERRRLAPKPRLACVYDVTTRKYRYYTDGDWARLVVDLAGADEIISFNGKQFDVLVLQAHCGFPVENTTATHPGHVDIHEIMTMKAGFLVSLNKAVTWNFDERKHTDGRSISDLSPDNLKKACRSDVSQTYRLWKLHIKGELYTPTRRPPIEEMEIGGPGQFMRRVCPNCHDVGSLRFEEAEMEDMTEGQFAEYVAGTWGVAVCTGCHGVIYWQM